MDEDGDGQRKPPPCHTGNSTDPQQKINATNSWNFALIDYFHDMSLLREGDSVNFQKASCTLDGCVKIYTSRVDSVATETGKLLSGLADSSSKKQNEGRSGVNDEGEEEEEEEEGEDGVRRRAKRKVQRSSEATLAPSFQQLQLKKMELEFSVDPLFKKASADFDEGGAKGLLLNHLTMDGNGRIAFDSSDDNREEEREQSSEGDDTTGARDDTRTSANCPPETGDTLKDDQPVIELATLQQRFFPDLSKLNEQDICPSLKSFELDGIAESLNTPFLKAPEDWRKDQSPSKNDNGEESQDAGDGIPTPEDDNDDGDLGGFDIGMDVGFGEGGEAWAKEAAMNSQSKPFDAALSGANGIGDETEQQVVGYSADSAQYGVTLSQDHDRENILSYFDQALHKNWAGPEHWRIRKIKDFSKPAAPPRQRKEKEPYEIDFAAPLTQSMADVVYNPAANNSAISLPKSQWKSKTRNLLPDDKHFNSRQLLRLFLKPKARIGGRRPTSGGRRGSGVENVVEGELDEAFWARRHQDAAASLAAGEEAQAHGDYDANFFQDDGLGALPGIDDDGDEFADARETFSPDLGMEAQPAADSIDNGLAPGSQDGFGNQLVTQSRRLRPEYVQYARVAKKVDVRRLKEEMWRGMGLDDHVSRERKLHSHTSCRPCALTKLDIAVYPSHTFGSSTITGTGAKGT